MLHPDGKPASVGMIARVLGRAKGIVAEHYARYLAEQLSGLRLWYRKRSGRSQRSVLPTCGISSPPREWSLILSNRLLSLTEENKSVLCGFHGDWDSLIGFRSPRSFVYF
jgi:hypothetical protein